MIRLFFSLMASAVLLLTSCSNGTSQSTLNAQAFSEKIKQLPDAVVIDVRTPEEFSKGHLQHAVNIDWNGKDFGSSTAKLDKSKPVFVYCLVGGRSAKAAAQMRDDGFKEVYEMEGGMMKWRAAGLPETTNDKTATYGLTKAQFDSLTRSGKQVLVDFYADWCGPCKRMKPHLDEISQTMADKVTVIRINADDNTALCKELGIDALPVVQLYHNGEAIWNHRGYASKEEITAQLR